VAATGSSAASHHNTMKLLSYYINWRTSPATATAILILAGAIAGTLWHPALWPWTTGAVLLSQLWITAAGLWPRSRLLGPNWVRLPAAAASRGEVAITIDDGPDPQVTPRVLDILDRYHAKATFFCIGSRAAQHSDLCREIVRRGHALENHSERHSPMFAFLGPYATRREIHTAQKTLTAITGQTPLFFRPPAGVRSPVLHPVLVDQGLRHASWTRRGFDARERDADRVLERLTTGLQAGDILLLHDGNAARTPSGAPVILAVLPHLLERISQAGLKPVTLRAALDQSA
jgi:peptidoglycan/xylan/chitin deacetylase (PgdA/CDA1 family)